MLQAEQIIMCPVKMVSFEKIIILSERCCHLCICSALEKKYSVRFRQNGKTLLRSVTSVTWLSFAQFVYFLRELCLLFNFCAMKFTIMFFFLHSHMIFLNYGHLQVKKTHLVEKFHVWMSKKTYLWILSFKNWNVNTLLSKNIQTEQN